MPSSRSVDPDLLCRTVQQLEARIARRFPEAGLRSVARDLIDVSACARDTCHRIGKPYYSVRIPIYLLLTLIAGLIVAEPFFIRRFGEVTTTLEFIQVVEPFLGTIFFLAAIVAFLLSLETRWKRARALDAIHELRAMAHVLDLHQLTKDPTDENMGESRMPPDDRPLTPQELTRYLDYVSEMLSLVGKVAVMYVQNFPDDVAVGAVDEIENLTNGISRKVWQKIAVLRREHPAHEVD
jgi:hypothetical protein